MRILISVAGMVRMAVMCFVLGIALGVYFGVAGTPDPVPPPAHPADGFAPTNATAP